MFLRAHLEKDLLSSSWQQNRHTLIFPKKYSLERAWFVNANHCTTPVTQCWWAQRCVGKYFSPKSLPGAPWDIPRVPRDHGRSWAGESEPWPHVPLEEKYKKPSMREHSSDIPVRRFKTHSALPNVEHVLFFLFLSFKSCP